MAKKCVRNDRYTGGVWFAPQGRTICLYWTSNGLTPKKLSYFCLQMVRRQKVASIYL
jgi:hypothetical protein